MKNLIQSLFFFFLVTQICFAQWYEQNTGTTQNLNCVFFIDANNGLAIGDSGTIVRTNNAGTNWDLIQSDVTNDLTSMCFTDSNNGWIVSDGLNTPGDSSVILHTTNGGQSWTKQWKVGRSTLYDIFFLNQQVGFTVGSVDPGGWEYSFMQKTTDSGVTWTQTLYDTILPITNIHFVNPDTGWIISSSWGMGSASWIYKTTNGGTSWALQFTTPGGNHILRDIWFTDSNNGSAVGLGHFIDGTWGYVINTTDAGGTWTAQDIFAPIQLGCTDLEFVDIFPISYNSAVILGQLTWDCNFVICYWTTDGGTTWIPRPTSIYEGMNRMFFINEQNGWMIGNNGAIYHTTNGGVTFVEEEQIDGFPTEYNLTQNFPNPFNPSTTIKYSVPQTSQVQIKVFDVLGDEIETLVNQEKPAGTYELTWNAAILPSGVYFYKLKAGSFIETKKMLLMK